MSAGSYGAEASTAPAALMDCWTFMCTVCNVCRSDGGDQLVKVNRVKQTSKSVRLTEVVRALPVPTILHAPHVTAPLRDVWSARPGDGKDRMLHDEAFRSFSSMYVLGLCNRRRCLGVCWGRESSRALKVLAASGSTLYHVIHLSCFCGLWVAYSYFQLFRRLSFHFIYCGLSCATVCFLYVSNKSA